MRKLTTVTLLAITLLVTLIPFVPAQTPSGAYSSPAGGGVSLTPAATQTVIPTVSGAVPLQLQQPTTAVQTDFAVLGNNGIDTLFTVASVSNGQNSRNPLIKIGTSGVGPNEYSFNGQAAVLPGAGAVVPTFDFPVMMVQSATTPTLPVASTVLFTSAPAGTYEVTVYSVVTTSGVGGTNFIFNLIYTDAQQAQTIAEFTNTTFTAGNVNQGVFVVQNQAAANISYSITETGVFTTNPILALKIVLKRVL